MAKYLFPIAGVLAWSVGLAALSGFDAMDANTEAQMDAAQQKIPGKPPSGSDLASAEKRIPEKREAVVPANAGTQFFKKN